MRRPGPTVRSAVVEWSGGLGRARQDRVITEEPLEVRLVSPGTPPRRVAVTMRTPGADFDLATGLLVGEGVVSPRGHVATVTYCTDPDLAAEQSYNVVTVTLNAPPRREPAVRNVASTSACGVCGKDSLEAVREFGGEVVTSELRVDPGTVLRLPPRLRESQRLFDRTGGVHAAGLFRPDGDLLLVREDVGRHNAVDKVVGAVALDSLPDLPDTTGTVLCTSARAGFEIVQKAVLAGIPVVVAVGAATSLAVECAAEYGVTLLGFVRGDRLVVYAGGDRLG